MGTNLDLQSPIFLGSTGGWLSYAEKQEKYIIVWTSEKESFFELPTGGVAKMQNGENAIYFARKEQCLALGTQLRSSRISNYRIYRIFPNNEVQFLHPKDGTFPEKVNSGRKAVGARNFSIGKNPNPILVKFTGSPTYEV
uniref:Photosystem I reaction center subunit II n=1 Tax=Olisthodiscus luteus TaxID=83000 RepID=A0A7U0QFW6_OLILU|nr:photosystem I reaction center subunit II [Olisthodiscus luteus]YP_010152838.1 photosystem I reaction center subunit II [Olisthodiscus luteus]QQW50453.1 photosystem I reaction center subunit II [Olisthodiscus luteus]QQW50499.1 photosystem I reaction center subunit II [Olisthodiscus luteus]